MNYLKQIQIKKIVLTTLLLMPVNFASANFQPPNCQTTLTTQSSESLLTSLSGPLATEQKLKDFLRGETWFDLLDAKLLRYMSRVIVASGMVLDVPSLQNLPPNLQSASILLSPLFRDYFMRINIMEGRLNITQEQMTELVAFSDYFGENEALRLKLDFAKIWASICVEKSKEANRTAITLQMAWDALREALPTQNHPPQRDINILKRARRIITSFSNDETVVNLTPDKAQTQPEPVQPAAPAQPVDDQKLQAIKQIYAEVLEEAHARFQDFLATHYEHPLNHRRTPINRKRLEELRTIYDRHSTNGPPFKNLALVYVPVLHPGHKTNHELLKAIDIWLTTNAAASP